ncbi:MAG: purine-nucleoside phosphorylase, partial [Oscillospiraceae bacterium]
MKLYEKLLAAADSVKAAFESIPEIAVMLGTGQNEIFDLSDKQSLKYCDIPYFPKPANPSHSGVLYNDGRALYFSGRCHFYEGHSAEDTAFYVLLLKQLGCRVLIIT